MAATAKNVKSRKGGGAAPDSWSVRLLSSPAKTALFVFAIAFLAFANTIGHDFVWDDRDLIVENQRVRTLNAETVKEMFTTNFWPTLSRTGGYYRPVVSLSYHVQHQVFRGDPRGFHFANVMWNAIASALIFAFVYLLFGNAVFGVVTALLFALYPLHTENVAWVAGRTDLLAMLWSMASLVLYLVGRRRNNILVASGSLLAFLVALLAKESAAFVPVVILLMEVGPTRALVSAREQRLPRWVHPMPYFGVLAAYLLIRQSILGTPASNYERYADGLTGVLGVPLSVLAGYIAKIVYPFQLNGEWDAPVPGSLTDIIVLLGVVCLAAIIYLAIRYRRNAAVFLGGAFFVLGMLPVLNIVPIGEVSAERYLYIPSFGVTLILGSIFARALAVHFPAWAAMNTMPRSHPPTMSRARAKNLTAVLVVILLVFAAGTVKRNADWKNESVFFAKTAQASPNSPRAHLNVGNAARRQGDIPSAIAAYKRALDVDENYLGALSNLGALYTETGRKDEAMALMERALQQSPDNVNVISNMGSIEFQRGRLDEAARKFERALVIDDNYPIALFNLGLIQFQQQKYVESRRNFSKVAGRGPAFDLAYYYLAVIESSSGNKDGARRLAQEFLSRYTINDQFRRQAQSIVAPPPTTRAP